MVIADAKVIGAITTEIGRGRFVRALPGSAGRNYRTSVGPVAERSFGNARMNQRGHPAPVYWNITHIW